MAGHTFFGKQKLCYTEVSDFTDFQGIGNDPMYKRYDSVFSVIKKAVPANLWHFLATPEYSADEDQICWHVDKWNEHPIRLTELDGAEHDKYKDILEDTIHKYQSSLEKLNGEDRQIMDGAIKFKDDDQVYCSDGKVYLVAWGMTPDTHRHKVIGAVIHEFGYVKKYKITFDAGEHGTLPKLDKSMKKPEGYILTSNDAPKPTTMNGWDFAGWEPSIEGQTVNSDMNFMAQYVEKPAPVPSPPPAPEPPTPKYFNCKFDAGEHGRIDGESRIRKEAYTTLANEEIPEVTPNKGYEFKRWNISPNGIRIDEDKTFTAQYEKTIPWYRKWWFWLVGLSAGKGCLKWLLWLLLAIFLCWLLSWIFKGCAGKSWHPDPANHVDPIETIVRPDGKTIDDNGQVRPITGDDGRLPDGDMGVAPVRRGDGEEPPIAKQPGRPNTIANRLFLFMENENDNVESLAQDFKKAYPGKQYAIIGYDKEVKLLVIEVPENEHDQISKDISAKIPNHKFIVFDEEIYELNGKVSTNPTAQPGWHIKAINLQAGWAVTKGNPDIKIAIVDDGIEATHPMFKGRITDAYNVFTQNNKLSSGEGHGTHTAGLAAGSSDFIGKGATGVAPNCMLMPIQVFDNGQCPLSALVAGVMYAIHHDADVINLSVGPSFKGLNELPLEQQEQIARSQFKNVERLWERVCMLAAKKKCILVFAAGNDGILSCIPPENRNEASIVVAAVDHRLYPTEFTNFGAGSDISAPGKDIYSSFPKNGFQSFDGTSMAAPIVAGTIALMKSLKKDLTVSQIRNVLYRTGADVHGNIPPMVQVDKTLQGVRSGDFTQPAKRETTPVPDYDAIRKQIAEYKKKIIELEKLLPKNE